MTRSLIVTSPKPSMFLGRASRRITWGCVVKRSSAESSMVMMRSVGGMQAESALSNVVFPLPVPPETAILRLRWTAQRKKVRTSLSNEPRSRMSSSEKNCSRNLRIVRIGPSSERGGMIAFTRCPCLRRALTIGDVSSMRLPSGEMIRSMSAFTSLSFLKQFFDR